jgi:ribonuclease III
MSGSIDTPFHGDPVFWGMSSEMWSRDDIVNIWTTLWVDVTCFPDDETIWEPWTHKSFAADFKTMLPHQERLEFLWDAVLELGVAHELFLLYPDLTESSLTLLKIYLVKEQTLATIARELGIAPYIRLSRGERQAWWADKDAILADTLEALLGYMYLYCPKETIAKFIKTHIVSVLLALPTLPTKSFKNLFQELIQKEHKSLPVYSDNAQVDPVSGLEWFTVSVAVWDRVWGSGWWTNKKQAQELAAQHAYDAYMSFLNQ